MPLKPGWSRNTYFNKSWQTQLARTLTATHNCTITVTVTDETLGTFDPITGETIYPPNATKVLFLGTARVQPRGASFEKNNQAADTSIRRVQFQLPLHGLKKTRIASYGVVLDDEPWPVVKEVEEIPNLTVVDGEPTYREGADTYGVVVDDADNPSATPLYEDKPIADIRPGALIRVTECELYPEMTKFDYRVQGVVNSGNPIEITLYAMVDQEVIVGD